MSEMTDFEAILQLCSEYNFAFDERRPEDWAACFTEDGFFERSNAGRSYRGREEIAGLAREYPVDGRHITAEHIIHVDGDTATHRSYLLYLDRKKGFSVDLFGVYDDKLVKVDGQWLFTERLLTVDLDEG